MSGMKVEPCLSMDNELPKAQPGRFSDLRQRNSGARMTPLTLSGVSLGQALVGTGAAKDVDSAEASDGGELTIFQAFMVAFCICFGGNVAMVGWYPKLAGLVGFPVVMAIMGTMGALAENSLHTMAIRTKAASFEELTASLPAWMSKLTSISQIVWGFIIAGLYSQFVYTFINDQVLGSRFPPSGAGAAPLYGVIAVAMYIVMLPPKFAGCLVKVITKINLATTWVVVVVAVAKGVTMILSTPPEERPEDLVVFSFDGCMQVIVLLAAAMFQCTAVPRIQYELRPELRTTAAWVIPLMLGSVQFVVFLFMGYAGYLALGNSILDSGDVFASYFEVAPDWMVTVLQGGIGLLMFLSLPLLGVPPKAEIWANLGSYDASGERIQFEEAPLVARHVINAIIVAFAVLAPMLLGRGRYTTILTIGAGTAANWMNLLLPCIVIVSMVVLPAKKAGEPYLGSAIKAMAILCLALVCLWSSMNKILGLFMT